jgi:NADH-quinone oxidoreductase subunit L
VTLWLAVAAPLAGAAVITLAAGAIGRRGIAAVGAGSLAVSFGVAVAVAQAFAAGKASLVADLGPWLPLRGSALALRLDPSTVPLVVATTAIGLVVAVHSIGWLSHRARWRGYFAALTLIVAGTLLVILARDLLLLIAGCEIAAASAYLLITHRTSRSSDADAGVHSFVAGRAADVALLLAAFALLALFGTVDLDEIATRLAAIRLTQAADSMLFIATALLVIAALARSAQLPFHGWLPATLAAPSPATALLHSVSGALIGVIVLVRVAPLLHPGALLIAAAVGGATALLGAIAALAEDDPRRAVTWSTAAQAGLMFAAIGAGAPGVALFHLMAHALAKATLLLTLDASSPRTPVTAIGVVTGALGLGLLPPSATFFSASALAVAFSSRPALLAVLLVVALLSALHAGRVLASTFGPSAAGAHVTQTRELGAMVLVPALILGSGTLVFGALVAGGRMSLGTVVPTPSLGDLLVVAAAAIAGVALGVRTHARRPRRLASTGRVLARLDRADALVARGFTAFASLLAGEGEAILRKTIDAFGGIAQRGSVLADRLESGRVRAHQTALWAAVVALIAYWALR